MSEFDFSFEDVGLSLGTLKEGARQTIALITGQATIEAEGRGRDTEWYITSVTLDTPIGPNEKYSSAVIDARHPLFNFVTESIEWTYGDKIWDEALEAQRPDPDYERERRLGL